MDGFEYDAADIEIDYEVYAIKDKEKMDAFLKGDRSSKPSTVAYALRPVVKIGYTVDDHSGVCETYDSIEYFVFKNDKKDPALIGTKYDGEDELEEAN